MNYPVSVFRKDCTLQLNLELMPKVANTLTSDEALSAQVRADREREAERDRRFFAAAKAWWKDFLQIRPEHAGRMVKLFARTESDVNMPVCAFVRPLRAGRALRSAGEAARFVGLIEYERLQTLGVTAGRSEVWSDMHTVLSSRKGDVEEHALLLCSLLLGFRFNCFCAIGSTQSGDPHMWVVSVETDATVSVSAEQRSTACAYDGRPTIKTSDHHRHHCNPHPRVSMRGECFAPRSTMIGAVTMEEQILAWAWDHQVLIVVSNSITFNLSFVL